MIYQIKRNIKEIMNNIAFIKFFMSLFKYLKPHTFSSIVRFKLNFMLMENKNASEKLRQTTTSTL